MTDTPTNPEAPTNAPTETAVDAQPITQPGMGASDAAQPETKAVELDATTQAEIEAAMSDLADAGAASDDAKSSKKIRGPRVVRSGREHRTGTVVSVGASDVFVEFGPKELGVVDALQFKETPPAVGDSLEVVVTRYEATDSLYICAIPGAVTKADWEMLEQGQTIEARVTGVNKGGLELEIANHRAFMPAGQVGLGHIADLSVFVGEKMKCQIQKIDRRGGGNIVLSRREILAAERVKLAEELQGSLKEGDILEGTIRKIMPFGAFVDIGGIDGLVHANDLTYERIGHGEKAVAKFVKEGEKLRVVILKLDWENNRIGLGVKQLQADPFVAATAEVVEGAELTGKITKIMDFGAFVEVAPGIEGLVHISELDWKRVNEVSDVVQENEIVNVKVLSVDPSDRKVSLSIKQLKDRPEQPSGGGRGGRGGGRGRQEQDNRTPEEIRKDEKALGKLREQAQKRGKKGGGGLGSSGGMGMGLGDLKL